MTRYALWKLKRRNRRNAEAFSLIRVIGWLAGKFSASDLEAMRDEYARAYPSDWRGIAELEAIACVVANQEGYEPSHEPTTDSLRPRP